MAEDVKKEELDTSSDTSAEEQGADKGTEEMVPKSVMLQRLKEVKEGTEKKIKKQLEDSGQEQKPPVDEGRQQEKAKLREMIVEIGEEEQREEKKALEERNQKIKELKTIDPTLDDKSLLGIMEKYGVDVDNAFKIYNDIKGGQVPQIKPKLPTATKTTDEVKEELFKPKERGNLYEAAQEGLKKFGLN